MNSWARSWCIDGRIDGALMGEFAEASMGASMVSCMGYP